MENELKEILEQLKSLTARVEALIEACATPAAAPAADSVSVPEPSETPAPQIADSPAASADICFTLNDRFRFQRVLFGNSAERMANAMAAISAMTTADEVYTYLTNVLDQDVTDPDVEDFFRTVTLRFADHKPLIL